MEETKLLSVIFGCCGVRGRGTIQSSGMHGVQRDYAHGGTIHSPVRISVALQKMRTENKDVPT